MADCPAMTIFAAWVSRVSNCGGIYTPSRKMNASQDRQRDQSPRLNFAFNHSFGHFTKDDRTDHLHHGGEDDRQCQQDEDHQPDMPGLKARADDGEFADKHI